MKADTTVTITPSTIREWEDEALRLENDASKMVREAKRLRALAEAGTLLLEPVADDAVQLDDESGHGNMIDSMAEIANTADKPLTKAMMKSRLMTLGYPEERMGNYFYTCIARLKGKKRITVLPDGRIAGGTTP